MFDNRKNNPTCDFGEEVVSYLYEDFSDADKKTFEDHLVNCTNCADELAALGFVSSSIQDWKQLEFNGLESPNIKIEFEKKTGWLDKFNKFLSPLILKTATGFAAVAILFGLGWFVFNSLQNNQTLETADKNKKEDIFEKDKEIKNKNLPPEKVTDINKSNVNLTETNQITDNSNEKSLQKIQVKGKNKSTNIERKSNSNITAQNKNRLDNKKIKQNSADSKPQKTFTVEQKPSLTEFAVEDGGDDNIRLSDIFDEVGSDR